MPAIALAHDRPRAAAAERPIALWLLLCCAMVFLMVVIGGITRLTESGLSITEWQPVTGVVPPMGEAQWAAEFARYKAIPQYRAIHADMALAQFKGIFFWEYLHRLWGRLIGVVFLLPFLYFLLRRRIPPALGPKLAAIFLLGGLQGALGWYMVESGLAGRIEVSQYRLAAHLAAALLIYAAMLWTALDLLARPSRAHSRREEVAPAYWDLVRRGSATPPNPAQRADLSPTRRRDAGTLLRRGLTLIIVLVFTTMVAGSFVAGLRAGYVFNTFPLMNGSFAPEGYWHLSPWYRNWFENLGSVQFDHRLLAETTWLVIAALWLYALRRRLAPLPRTALHALFALASLQFALGVATLLLVVPLPLAVLHQANALLLITAALVARHGLRVRPAS